MLRLPEAAQAATAHAHPHNGEGERTSMLVLYSFLRAVRILRAHSATSASSLGLGGDSFFRALAHSASSSVKVRMAEIISSGSLWFVSMEKVLQTRPIVKS